MKTPQKKRRRTQRLKDARPCLICKKEFRPKRTQARVCSPRCRKELHKRYEPMRLALAGNTAAAIAAVKQWPQPRKSPRPLHSPAKRSNGFLKNFR